MKAAPVSPQQITQAHALYCQLTGQNLSLGFDRERMWFELLRLGYGLEQLRRVVIYLQREIRAQRRNVGALKLSNLLQPERFEEDLAISYLTLNTPAPKQSPPPPLTNPNTLEQGRQRALECLQKLKADLHIISGPGNNLDPSRQQHEKPSQPGTEQFED